VRQRLQDVRSFAVTRKSAAVFVPTVLALLALVLVPATFAAKGGNAGAGGKPSGGSSSLTLRVLSSPNDDGLPHYGYQVTFDVSTTATDKPSVSVSCSQSGVEVYRASAGFYPEYPWPWAQTFTLSSGAWTGGAADCTATLYHVNSRGKSTTLKTLGFYAYA
jgi:hypothetical protein